MVLNGADVSGVAGRAIAHVRLSNFNRLAQATAVLTLFPWAGADPTSRQFPIEPGRTEVLRLETFSSISPGRYAATIGGEGSVGLLTRTEWPDAGSAVTDGGARSGTELAAPLVFKRFEDRCSTVVVHNGNPDAQTQVTIALYPPPPGSSVPLMQETFTIERGGSVDVAFCEDRAFEALPDSYRGPMIVRSDRDPISAEVLTAYSGGPGVAAYGAVPVAFGATDVLMPLIHSQWSYTPDTSQGTAYESIIAVQNVSESPITVQPVYTGTKGMCAGWVMSEVERPVPPLGLTIITPGSFYPSGLLPGNCAASAAVHSIGGGIVAVVLDEKWRSQYAPPTATPTSLPTHTSNPTSTPTETGTPAGPVTPTATGTAIASPTPAPAARLFAPFASAGRL